MWLGGKNCGAIKKQSTEIELNEVIEENSRFMTTGLNTILKPKFGIKTAKHGSDILEGFLTAVEKNLPKEAFRRRRFKRLNKKTREIYEVLQRLKNPDLYVFQQTKPIS